MHRSVNKALYPKCIFTYILLDRGCEDRWRDSKFSEAASCQKWGNDKDKKSAIQHLCSCGCPHAVLASPDHLLQAAEPDARQKVSENLRFYRFIFKGTENII